MIKFNIQNAARVIADDQHFGLLPTFVIDLSHKSHTYTVKWVFYGVFRSEKSFFLRPLKAETAETFPGDRTLLPLHRRRLAGPTLGGVGWRRMAPRSLAATVTEREIFVMTKTRGQHGLTMV